MSCIVVCDLETSWMRRPWPTGSCRAKNKHSLWVQVIRSVVFKVGDGRPRNCLMILDTGKTAFEQDQDGTSWSCSKTVCKSVWHIPLLCVQWKTPDDGQRICPKHVQFHSENKFEKLVHLVGFIIRNVFFYLYGGVKHPSKREDRNRTKQKR